MDNLFFIFLKTRKKDITVNHRSRKLNIEISTTCANLKLSLRSSWRRFSWPITINTLLGASLSPSRLNQFSTTLADLATIYFTRIAWSPEMSRPRFQGSHSHSLLSTHIYMETDTYMVLIQAISCMSYIVKLVTFMSSQFLIPKPQFLAINNLMTILLQEQVCCMLQTIQQNGTPSGAHENIVSLSP